MFEYACSDVSFFYFHVVEKSDTKRLREQLTSFMITSKYNEIYPTTKIKEIIWPNSGNHCINFKARPTNYIELIISPQYVCFVFFSQQFRKLVSTVWKSYQAL